MSDAIGPSPDYGAWQRTNLEITCKVFNEQTGRWERTELKPGEQAVVMGALNIIRTSGQIDEALRKEQTVLEITGKRVFLRDPEAARYTDLTPDPGFLGRDSSDVKKIRSTLSQVAEVVKNMSRKGEREILEAGIHIDQAKAKREGGVVIELRVVPAYERLYERINKAAVEEGQAYVQIENASDSLQTEEWKEFLNERGFTDEQIDYMQWKVDALKDTQSQISSIITEVNRLVSEGDYKGAVKYYNDYMPEAMGAYCEAFREWEPEQNLLREILGERDNPFLFQPRHQIHLGMAKSIFEYAEKIIPGQVGTENALGWIEFHAANLDHYHDFAGSAHQRFTELFKAEAGFQTHVVQALEPFEDREFIDFLKSEGFSEEEISLHKGALEELREVSELMLQQLASVDRYFEVGAIREGIDSYQKEAAALLPRYQAALSALAIPQRLAANRLRGFMPFSLKLGRIDLHQKCLEGISRQQEELGLRKSNGVDPVVDFQPSLEVIAGEKNALDEAQEFARLSGHLNDWQKRGEDFLTSMGIFVEAFATRREELEALMREEGFSDTQTAAIFNHYVLTYEAFKDWYSSLQEVTDLANRKEYAQAIERLSQLVKLKYPKIAECMRNGLPYTGRYEDKRTQKALSKFLGAHPRSVAEKRTGEIAISAPVASSPKSPQTVMHVLNIQRFSALFSVEMTAFRNEIGEVEGLEVPESFDEALETVGREEKANNARFGEEASLYTQDARFMRFFNFFGIRAHPLYGSTWKNILHQQGWTIKEAENFMKLYNDYAELIQHLQIGERGLALERDPVKKRALRLQLQQLGMRMRPRLEELEKEFNRLGGYERLSTLTKAVNALSAQIGDASILRVNIGAEYNENRHIYASPPFNFQSPEDLIAGIEIVYQQLPDESTRAVFDQQFGSALNLVRTYTLSQAIQQEAESLQNLMHDRRQFFGAFFTRHHFFIPWDDQTVGRTLMTGAQIHDPNYRRIINERGWQFRDIQAFSDWYDAYNTAIHPVQLAEARLAEDPENVLLQQEFQRVYDRQIDKINTLATQFRKKFGLQKLQELEWGLAVYTNRLAKDIENTKASLEVIVGEENRKPLQSRLEALTQTVESLSRVNYSRTIEKMNEWMTKASTVSQRKTSWEKGYLSELTAKNSPLSIELKQSLPQGLSFDDVKAIERLFGQYQDELRKINQLERKLAAVPENGRVRQELRKELQSRVEKLNRLNNKRSELGDKIVLLQTTVDGIKKSMEKGLKKVLEAEEGAAAFGQIDSMDAEAMRHHVSLERSRSLAGRSDEQARALILQCERMQVEQAFAEKVGFMKDVYKRHGMSK